MKPSLATLLVLGTVVTACGVDTSADENVQSQSAALRPRDDDDPGPPEPPEPPEPDPDNPAPQPSPTQPSPAPAPAGTTVRISSDELNGALLFLLAGTKFVIDTTGKSPTIPSDPFYHCWYPNQQIREEETARCMEYAGTVRAECLRQMNIDYPHVEQCGYTTGPVHSYIDFGPSAEFAGAKDVPFEGIAPIERDSSGPGGVTIDVNYLRAEIDSSNKLFAYFMREGTHQATASVWVKLTSDQPTLPCDHSLLTCPDVQLTDMELNIRLRNLGPVVGDPTTLGFDAPESAFYFDSNVNNVPDWFAGLFIDVDQIIRNNVRANVNRAIERATSRAAIDSALTKLAVREASTKNGSRGIDRFYKTWYDGNSLVVDYEPCPDNLAMPCARPR